MILSHFYIDCLTWTLRGLFFDNFKLVNVCFLVLTPLQRYYWLLDCQLWHAQNVLIQCCIAGAGFPSQVQTKREIANYDRGSGFFWGLRPMNPVMHYYFSLMMKSFEQIQAGHWSEKKRIVSIFPQKVLIGTLFFTRFYRRKLYFIPCVTKEYLTFKK